MLPSRIPFMYSSVERLCRFTRRKWGFTTGGCETPRLTESALSCSLPCWSSKCSIFVGCIGQDEDTKFILTDHHKLDLFLFVFANRRKRIIFALRPADLPSGPTGCSAVRLAHLLWEQGVLSSNLSTPTWKRA